MGRKTQFLEMSDDPQHQDCPADNADNQTTHLSAERKALIPKNQPHTKEKQWRTDQKNYWERQINIAKWLNGITLIAAIVGLVGLIFIWETLKATQNQARIALDQLRSQRPYMSLGKADGTIAEYIPPDEGKSKGTILLYFQNTGPVAATSFLVNVFNNLPLKNVQKDRHIERWRLLYKGWPSGKMMGSGATVGANSVYSEALNPNHVPPWEEWKLIEADQLENGFHIMGNLEYCDWWGDYHCEMFTVEYTPSPVNKFIATWNIECPFWPPTDPNKGVSDPMFETKLLPRCKQPEERIQRKEQFN